MKQYYYPLNFFNKLHQILKLFSLLMSHYKKPYKFSINFLFIINFFHTKYLFFIKDNFLIFFIIVFNNPLQMDKFSFNAYY